MESGGRIVLERHQGEGVEVGSGRAGDEELTVGGIELAVHGIDGALLRGETLVEEIKHTDFAGIADFREGEAGHELERRFRGDLRGQFRRSRG